MMSRLKMSNRTFRAILIPIAAILLVLIIAFTVAGNMFGNVLDTTLGRGDRHVVVAEGTENWDAEYYEQKYENFEDSRNASLEMNLKVVEEGTVLLKNNGALPLSKDTEVTPFGKGYKFPIYCAPGSASIKYVENHNAVNPKDALAMYFTNINNSAINLQPNGTSGSSQSNNSSDYSNYPAQPKSAPNTIDHTTGMFGGNGRLPELAVSEYDKLTQSEVESMKDSTALIYITRGGMEGADLKLDGYDDGTPHYLALSKNEKDMIKKAKELCSKVVIVFVSSNPIELGPVMSGECEADAIVWAGNPGENGFIATTEILCGEVNPSGRLVDIYASDFTKLPAYANYGDFYYSNAWMTEWGQARPEGPSGIANARYRSYVEYEEGMYNGYRYYETAHDIGESGFVYGELDVNGGVVTPGEVCYPFGYGLSYTEFESSIEGFSVNGNNVNVTVKVTNVGDKAGKEVVQLYYTPPYTELDETLKIEKPTVTLVDFAKTKLLDPDEDQTITITFSIEDMTSYAYNRDNGDGTQGCYMLEEGDYVISLRKNSHDVIDTETWHNNSTIWYDNSNPRQHEKDMQSAMDEEGNMLPYPEERNINPDAKYIAATNLFPYMSEYMEEETTMFTRTAWETTFPENTRTSGLPQIKEVSQKYIDMFGIEQHFDSKTNPLMGDVPGSNVYTDVMPTSYAENNLVVTDMRGKDYYDENWELLLDQIDWEADKKNIEKIITGSNYFTDPVDSIGLLPSVHCEGANGVRIDNAGSGSNGMNTATYCMEPLMASTWNVELMYEMGAMWAQEALVVGKHGRYSPAINLHRTPFNGRVMEYYSEDPLLTGKIAAAVVSGTSSGGMFDYLKHFGLNDQETRRAEILHTWATEQVIREIYNRPFEICIREARKTIKYIADTEGTVKTRVMRGCTGMMVAQNCFGPTIAFANYDLVTKLVRREWGFKGIINTDMYYWPSLGMYELTNRAGVDCWLAWMDSKTIENYDSATTKSVIRESLHHVAYTVVNSSAAQGATPGSIIYYDISPWKIGLIFLNIGVYLIIAGLIAWIIVRAIKEKKHPERYYNKKRAKSTNI